jgi:hypothetical protein
MRRGERAWRVAGIIEAPPEQVWEALLESNASLSEAEKAQLRSEQGPACYATTVGKPGAGRIYLEVNRLERSIAVQGEWWYRGVTRVRPDNRGSLLSYEVFNVAPGVGWWAAQLVQGPQHARQMQRMLREQLAAIGRRLGRTSYPLEQGALR